MKCVLIAALLLAAVFADAQASSPEILWSLKTNNVSQYGDPVVYQNFVFVGTQFHQNGVRHHGLKAIDRWTGVLQWETVGRGQGLYLAAGDGKVYYGSDDKVTAYDARGGYAVWEASAPSTRTSKIGAWPGKPTYANGIVYCTWYNTPAIAVHSKNGSLIFTSPTYAVSRIFVQDIDGASQLFYMGSSMEAGKTGEYALSRVDAKTGAAVYATNMYPSGVTSYASLVSDSYGIATLSWPVGTTNETTLSSYCPHTGKMLWAYTGTEPTKDTNFDYNILLNSAFGTYQNSTNGYIVFGRDLKTGDQKWIQRIDSTDSSINLAAFDRTVFVVALTTGRVFAYDAIDGTHLWTLDVAAPYYGVGTENVYYMGANTDTFMAVRIRKD